MFAAFGNPVLVVCFFLDIARWVSLLWVHGAGKQAAARAELALLRAIPAMAVHSAALPFVTRSLQQLSPHGVSRPYL